MRSGSNENFDDEIKTGGLGVSFGKRDASTRDNAAMPRAKKMKKKSANTYLVPDAAPHVPSAASASTPSEKHHNEGSVVSLEECLKQEKQVKTDKMMLALQSTCAKQVSRLCDMMSRSDNEKKQTLATEAHGFIDLIKRINPKYAFYKYFFSKINEFFAPTENLQWQQQVKNMSPEELKKELQKYEQQFLNSRTAENSKKVGFIRDVLAEHKKKLVEKCNDELKKTIVKSETDAKKTEEKSFGAANPALPADPAHIPPAKSSSLLSHSCFSPLPPSPKRAEEEAELHTALQRSLVEVKNTRS